jgi:hypothetical protein
MDGLRDELRAIQGNSTIGARTKTERIWMDRGIGDADAHSCNDRLATASFTCGESHFSKSPFANGTFPHCCGRITARIAIELYIVAAARTVEMDARRGGFGGRGGAARPKRRFVNPSPVCASSGFSTTASNACAGFMAILAVRALNRLARACRSGSGCRAVSRRRPAMTSPTRREAAIRPDTPGD